MALWTRLPEAAMLLASCSADPPPMRAFVFRFQEIDLRFVGRRVRRLRRLYRTAEPAIDTPDWQVWLALDPQRAIAAAVRRNRVERPAASASTLSRATAG